MNFLERTLAMFKVKQAEKKGQTETSLRFSANEEIVKTCIITREAMQDIPSLVPTNAQAALWFLKNYDGTKSLYVLTHKAEGTSAVRAAISVADNLPEVAAFADAKKANSDASTLKKCSNLAAASIVCAIGKIADPILGYTLDKNLADSFAHSLDPDTAPSIDTDIETLRKAWRSIAGPRPSYGRRAFLTLLLKEYSELVPNDVIIDLMYTTPTPFDDIGWYMVLHQIKLGRPLDYTVFKAVVKSDVLQSCLGNGKRIDGLDFSGQTQLSVILYAIQNNRNIGELRDTDTWKPTEEMKSIYHQWKNSPAPERTYDDDTSGEYYGDAYAREREEKQAEYYREQEEKKQEKARQAQLDAIRAQTNAVLDAQIAQLKVQLDNVLLDYQSKRISSTERSMLTRSIQRQILDLESKKQR